MAYIDISRTLDAGIAVWPGDTHFTLSQTLDRGRGDSVNLTTMTLSTHTGTHVDAPLHYADDDAAITDLDLAPFWGRAQVVRTNKSDGPLYPGDFNAYDLSLCKRLLVRSIASELDHSQFPAHFVYPSPELADHLGSLGIVLFGTDSPSMDYEDSKTLDGHRALRRNGIAVLEWLDLSRAADGLYQLAALPLKIAAADGSPVRAVLRPIVD